MAFGESKQSYGAEGVPRMSEQRVVMPFRVNAKAMKSLKVLARREKTTVTGLLIEAVNDLLKKHGRKPEAKQAKMGRPKGG